MSGRQKLCGVAEALAFFSVYLGGSRGDRNGAPA